MSMAASPHDRNTVVAGGDVGGVFVSRDGGQTWTPRNTGLRDFWVEAIAFHPGDPKVVYIGGKSGVYKSADGGQTWAWQRGGFPPVAGFSYSAPVGSLAIDPAAPGTIYAGIGSQRQGIGAQGAVYKSTNGGEQWFKVNSSGIPANAIISSLAIHPSNNSRLFLSSNKGVYESTDGGINWTARSAGLPLSDVRQLAIAKSNPNVLYVTLRTPTELPWRGGVYKSTDGGLNWAAANTGLQQRTNAADDENLWSQYFRLAVDPGDDRIVYACTTDYVTHTVFRTADGGASWSAVFRKPPAAGFDAGWNPASGYRVESMAMSPFDPRLIYFGDGMHTYKTPDAGASWQQLFTKKAGSKWQTTGLETSQSWMLAVDPRNSSRVFFGYADIGLWISEDGGQSFPTYQMPPREANESPYAFAVTTDPADPKRLWAVLNESSRVYETLDGGGTWAERAAGLPVVPIGQAFRRRRQILLDPETRKLLVNIDGKAIYASGDGGLIWSASGTGLPAGADVRDLIAHPSDPKVYWCLLAGSGASFASVYRSTDRGATWTLVSNATLHAHNAYQLVVARSDPRKMYLAARQVNQSGVIIPGGIFASNDGGESWTRALTDSFAYAVAVDPVDANIVYAGLRDDPFHDESLGGGVRRSTDGGSTWVSIDDDLPTRCIRELAIDPADRKRLYVGTCGNGVFRLDPSQNSPAGTLPLISRGGVVIHDGVRDLVSPGSLVDIYGIDFAAAAVSASGGVQLPLRLGGVAVRVNGAAAPLIFVGPFQIIFQMPYEAQLGIVSVAVVAGESASAAETVLVQQAAPYILTYGNNKAVIVNQDGTVNATGNGAPPGGIVVAYLIGSGPLDNEIPTGAPAPLTPLSRQRLNTRVTVGGVNATVRFAGMAPGFVGLVQVNFEMPNAAFGERTVQVTIGSASSNQPLVTVAP